MTVCRIRCRQEDQDRVRSPPAPAASASALLSVFDGSDPNGTWRLFVQDEYAPTDPGAFSNGWALEIKAQVKAKKKKR